MKHLKKFEKSSNYPFKIEELIDDLEYAIGEFANSSYENYENLQNSIADIRTLNEEVLNNEEIQDIMNEWEPMEFDILLEKLTDMVTQLKNSIK